MHRQGVIRRIGHRIRFVDPHLQIPFLPQQLSQQVGKLRLAVKQQPNLPGTRVTLEHRRKTVHRDNGGRLFAQLPFAQRIVNAVMIRQENFTLASQRVLCINADIAGNRRQFRQMRDRTGDTGRPVAVNH
ncbi:hypothetical protein D3C79_881160 [compost metagenome]